MKTRHRLYLGGFFFLLLVAPLSYQVDRTAMSLPTMEGEIELSGLAETVAIEFDEYGVPGVTASSRLDAYRTLGFLHARDRLFQMDLMRRKSAGRLAEIFGEKVVAFDRQQRIYRFNAAAERVWSRLPDVQKSVLQAYAEGVNETLAGMKELPPEFRLLHYRPELWRPTDSLLVSYGMFQLLSDQQQEERMLTIMAQTLPADLYAFLTPDDGPYAQTLMGGEESHRPQRPVPMATIAALLRERQGRYRAAVEADPESLGSNNWVVSGAKTVDGRAIVANDMHLPLGLPNVWYRATLRHPGVEVTGVTLPGVPLIVAGSNRHVAWGFTNVYADLVDLVRLETDPSRPGEYRTPGGWQPFEIERETLLIKEAEPRELELRGTIWGPVAEKELLGQPVAIHWSALDPDAVNFGLIEMASAGGLEEAQAILNRSGAPPQNVVLADEQGHIAWTYMGYIPRRHGFDGSVSRSWADGSLGWNGYIPPEELPRLVDPPEGFIATANHRTVGKAYPYLIGHDFPNAYRAYRIRQQLSAHDHWSEPALFDLQQDTLSEFYEYYRALALEVLERVDRQPASDLAEIERVIRLWDGRMEPESLGIALLARWRSDLADALFAPLLERCVRVEPGFVYRWHQQETPLRALLTERPAEVLPEGMMNWDLWLRERLQASLASLKSAHGIDRAEDLSWGRTHPIRLRHPFSQAQPWLSPLLDLEPLEGACNGFCIKVLQERSGASERMVVSPAHPEEGILHMPGGQSGHPFSPHYRDQSQAWREGEPIPFLPQGIQHRLRLQPVRRDEKETG